MNTTKSRTTYHVSIDANYVLAFLTATVVFGMFVFISLASIATDKTVQEFTAFGSETSTVIVATTS